MGITLFLSPHLDDAVLSCGGIIHRLVQRGERVIIVTAMAGEPSDDLPDSPVIDAVKARWISGMSPFNIRRREDAQAAQSLGAQVYDLALLECSFRTTVCGAGDIIALYPDHDSPFAGVRMGDDAPLTLFETHPPFKNVTAIYAPLCVDNHIDHRIVRDWSLVLTGSLDTPPLSFYEEYPHARNKTALKRAHDYYHQQLPAIAMTGEVVSLSEADLAAKLRALRCYRSHLQVLWNDTAEMERLTREFMIMVGDGTPAERCWHVVR